MIAKDQVMPPAGRLAGMQGVPSLVAVALVALVAVVAQGFPALALALEWRRESMGAGISFGILTGHLAHWSWDHLVWDLVAFTGLSMACLRIRPGRFLICLGISAVVIPIVVYVFHPALASYRGLSGIDSALFALFLTGLWRSPRAGSRSLGGARLLALAGGLLFLLKTGYELATGQAVFVESSDAGFVPLPSAHLAGFLAGLISGGFGLRGRPLPLEAAASSRVASPVRSPRLEPEMRVPVCRVLDR
jgi:rhomboid family GlyGly-CTERM serine protease